MKVSSNEQMFDKMIMDHRFCDIQVLSPETCLIILDGVCVRNHSSHPSISAKVGFFLKRKCVTYFHISFMLHLIFFNGSYKRNRERERKKTNLSIYVLRDNNYRKFIYIPRFIQVASYICGLFTNIFPPVTVVTTTMAVLVC